MYAIRSYYECALSAAGFSRTYEVALGADITADKEAHEFEERMERGDALMTTSCCPAYVRAVHIHVPELDSCVSETRSPMHYTRITSYNVCYTKLLRESRDQ